MCRKMYNNEQWISQSEPKNKTHASDLAVRFAKNNSEGRLYPQPKHHKCGLITHDSNSRPARVKSATRSTINRRCQVSFEPLGNLSR